MNRVELKISIARKGQGTTDRLVCDYSMKEHHEGRPLADGKAFAAKKYPNEDCIIDVWPKEDDKLMAAVRHEYKLSDDQVAVPKVHNPLQSCFSAYKRTQIAGRDLLVSEKSFGICYAEVNHAWEQEALEQQQNA